MTGKSLLKGISWVDLLKMFPDNDTAEKWFALLRWGGKPIACLKSGSDNVVVGEAHAFMPYCYRTCSKRFSVRIGTVMQDSNLGAIKCGQMQSRSLL
ncbi:MAG: hypothetical protein OXF08_09305 [Bacteroidetes bacterium]|nr:hypothetical protein [Bacteroidota bacterium]